ncbi:MAG: hypothetical protein ABW133_03025 [Polyangiaceae bacterium]
MNRAVLLSRIEFLHTSRRFVASLSAVAVLLAAPAALASESFPGAIKTYLNLPGDPPLCTVCHTTLIGGPMTVSKPFGKTLQQKYGLLRLDENRLRAALMQMQAANPPDDSDSDGIGDIAELLAGTDPNVKTGETAVDEGPNYGCQCSAARSTGGFSTGAFAWAAGVAIAGLRARRSRRARRGGRVVSQVLKSRSVVSNDVEG